LWIAIRGGAEVIGWPDGLGAIEVGMQFDAQLITFGLVSSEEDFDETELPGNNSLPRKIAGQDVGNFQVFGGETWEDRTVKWMYCADDRTTRKVWVGGDSVHERH
jgi:guanine deaminase